MATIRKRFLKTGAVVFDILIKVKNVNLQKMVIKTTTFRPDEKFNERQQERECLIFAQKFEKDMKNLYSGTSGESLDHNGICGRCTTCYSCRQSRTFKDKHNNRYLLPLY